MNSVYEKIKIYGPVKSFGYILNELYRRIWMGFYRRSYSQKGEDLVIDKILGRRNKGFYIDIGANDPSRFSNTKRFYDKGWKGINIEPDYDNFSRIKAARERDVNLNIGIANNDGKLEFYRFVPDTLSTFCKEEADEYVEQGYNLVEKIEVSVRKLSDVLKEHCHGREIDFMSIDTEGFDMQVLRSNDWNKFVPKLICIESVAHTMSGKDNEKDDNHEPFLIKLGYKKVYDNGLNSIYFYEK